MGLTDFEQRQASLLYCKKRLEVTLDLTEPARRVYELADVQERVAVLLREEEQALLEAARAGRLRDGAS